MLYGRPQQREGHVKCCNTLLELPFALILAVPFCLPAALILAVPFCLPAVLQATLHILPHTTIFTIVLSLLPIVIASQSA